MPEELLLYNNLFCHYTQFRCQAFNIIAVVNVFLIASIHLLFAVVSEDDFGRCAFVACVCPLEDVLAIGCFAHKGHGIARPSSIG